MLSRVEHEKSFITLGHGLEYSKRIYHECGVGIEKSVPRITTWFHEA